MSDSGSDSRVKFTSVTDSDEYKRIVQRYDPSLQMIEKFHLRMIHHYQNGEFAKAIMVEREMKRYCGQGSRRADHEGTVVHGQPGPHIHSELVEWLVRLLPAFAKKNGFDPAYEDLKRESLTALAAGRCPRKVMLAFHWKSLLLIGQSIVSGALSPITHFIFKALSHLR